MVMLKANTLQCSVECVTVAPHLDGFYHIKAQKQIVKSPTMQVNFPRRELDSYLRNRRNVGLIAVVVVVVSFGFVFFDLLC